MALEDKLIQINEVKKAIKQALINKKVNMDNVPFTDYASKIGEIKTDIPSTYKLVIDLGTSTSFNVSSVCSTYGIDKTKLTVNNFVILNFADVSNTCGVPSLNGRHGVTNTMRMIKSYTPSTGVLSFYPYASAHTITNAGWGYDCSATVTQNVRAYLVYPAL